MHHSMQPKPTKLFLPLSNPQSHPIPPRSNFIVPFPNIRDSLRLLVCLGSICHLRYCCRKNKSRQGQKRRVCKQISVLPARRSEIYNRARCVRARARL